MGGGRNQWEPWGIQVIDTLESVDFPANLGGIIYQDQSHIQQHGGHENNLFTFIINGYHFFRTF